MTSDVYHPYFKIDLFRVQGLIIKFNRSIFVVVVKERTAANESNIMSAFLKIKKLSYIRSYTLFCLYKILAVFYVQFVIRKSQIKIPV